MTITLDKPKDEIFLTRMSWIDFEKLQEAFSNYPGYRLSFYEGEVEILTVSPEHGIFSENLTFLLNLWLIEHGVSYINGGDFTIQQQGVASAQGDKSYWFGPRKAIPDLSIEVVISGEREQKLKKRYQALGVSEVWFWIDGEIRIHQLSKDGYSQVSESQYVKGINLELLAKCSTIEKQPEALKCFRSEGRSNQP